MIRVPQATPHGDDVAKTCCHLEILGLDVGAAPTVRPLNHKLPPRAALCLTDDSANEPIERAACGRFQADNLRRHTDLPVRCAAVGEWHNVILPHSGEFRLLQACSEQLSNQHQVDIVRTGGLGGELSSSLHRRHVSTSTIRAHFKAFTEQLFVKALFCSGFARSVLTARPGRRARIAASWAPLRDSATPPSCNV